MRRVANPKGEAFPRGSPRQGRNSFSLSGEHIFEHFHKQCSSKGNLSQERSGGWVSGENFAQAREGSGGRGKDVRPPRGGGEVALAGIDSGEAMARKGKCVAPSVIVKALDSISIQGCLGLTRLLHLVGNILTCSNIFH